MENNKKETFKISYVFLSLFLIVVGIVAAYFFINTLIDGSLSGIIFFIMYIPTMLILIVLPLYSGCALLIEQLKLLAGKGK